MTYFIIIFSLIVQPLWAKPRVARRPSAYGQTLIWTNGHGDQLRAVLPKGNFRIRDASDEAREMHEEGLLTPRERDQAFKKARVESKLRKLDDLAKDIVVLDTRWMSFTELRRTYPQLSGREASALKQAVGEYK